MRLKFEIQIQYFTTHYRQDKGQLISFPMFTYVYMCHLILSNYVESSYTNFSEFLNASGVACPQTAPDTE